MWAELGCTPAEECLNTPSCSDSSLYAPIVLILNKVTAIKRTALKVQSFRSPGAADTISRPAIRRLFCGQVLVPQVQDHLLVVDTRGKQRGRGQRSTCIV